MDIKRTITLAQIGEFFGVDPHSIQNIHLDANAPEGIQFRVNVVVLDENGKRIKDRQGVTVRDTLRIAVVD